MTETVLELLAVSKRYGRKEVLRDFSIVVKQGEIHGMLGPNGSGKSTCLHILTGLVQPTRGEVWLGDLPIESKAARALYGFAPDDLPLPASLTGAEYLVLHDALRARDDSVRARDLVELFGMSNELTKQLAEYSHGMRRKIQIVAAVMHSPRLLVLDEPFRGLDPEASATLRELIVNFAAAGGAAVIATHDMLRAQRDCTSVTILKEGVVTAEGAPKDLIASVDGAQDLEDYFLARTGRAPLGQRRGLDFAGMWTTEQ